MIEVLIDESAFPDPRLTMAGAIIFEQRKAIADRDIASLYNRLVDGLFYMDDEPSFQEFVRNGFHASVDPFDVSIPFVQFIAAHPGAKVLIEYSDHSRVPYLSTDETYLLLELRLAETILRKYHRASEVRFTFEQNDSLNKYYNGIIKSAIKRSQFNGRTQVVIGEKMTPPALALVDYALVLYGRAHQRNPKPNSERNWKAVRSLVSSVRSLDAGGIDIRRGLADK